MTIGVKKVEDPTVGPSSFDEMDDAAIKEAIREFRAKHGVRAIEPVDEKVYRDAMDALLSLAGTEPDLVAPPRRRFD